MIKRKDPWVLALILFCACHSGADSDKGLATAKEDPSTYTGFHFFVLGDWGRRGKASQRAVAGQMIAYAKRRHPAFIITTGDNFYEEGVRSVHDSHWKESFTDVYKELTRDYDWYPVLGNHDHQGHANPKAEMEYHNVNPRWHMPWYYSTMVVPTADGQQVRFLFIDTSPFYTLYYKTGECPDIVHLDTARQRKWIETTLANAKEEWKIVVGHHPVFSGGREHGITPELMSMLKPLMEKYKVQAYLCGHEHNLQHLQPGGSYVDYFVCGGGGDVIPVGKMAYSKFGASLSGFADVAIKNDSLWLQYIDRDGRVIYQYAKHR